MDDDLFERIENLTTDILKKGGTPLEQSAIGLLADCRYDLDTLNRQLAEKDAEIERLREACKNASSYISVRDQFAMAALTGMLMRSVGYEETSEKAYKFADAMIKTRTALGEKE